MAYLPVGQIGGAGADRCGVGESFKQCATRVARESTLCLPGESFTQCSDRFARNLVTQAETAQKAGKIDKGRRITADTPAAVLPDASVSVTGKTTLIAGIPNELLLGGAVVAFLLLRKR